MIQVVISDNKDKTPSEVFLQISFRIIIIFLDYMIKSINARFSSFKHNISDQRILELWPTR